MSIRTIVLVVLILLAVIDSIILFPVLGGSLIYVVLHKPSWFRNTVRETLEEPAV